MLKRLFRKISLIAVVSAMLATQIIPAFAYEVKSGDSLAKIAAANGCTVEQLMAWNGITDANKIYVGESLKTSETDRVVPTRTKPVYARVGLSNAEKAVLKTVFDAEYYKNNNPDVVAALGDSYDVLFKHFCDYGLWETRQPEENFNVNVYASAYSDLRDAYADKLPAERLLDYTLHYAILGKEENRTITTIEAAVNNGVTVEYVGSYTDGSTNAPSNALQTELEKYKSNRETYWLHSNTGHSHTPGDWYVFTKRCGGDSYWEVKCTDCGAICGTRWVNDPHILDESGVCTNCGEYCIHYYMDGVCIGCGRTDECTTHSYSGGICTVCHGKCVHFRYLHSWTSWTDGKCDECGEECEHDFYMSECRDCKKPCTHTYDEWGRCTTCGDSHDHVYSSGVCTICSHVCTHAFAEDGECMRCDLSCPHTDSQLNAIDGKTHCKECNAILD